MKNSIFCFFVLIFSLHFNSLIAQDALLGLKKISCDSLYSEILRGEIDYLVANPMGISRTSIDSTRWTIIGGERVFYRVSTVSTEKIKNILNSIDNEADWCSYLNYAHAFDYLLQKGLDLNYDYYTSIKYDEETSSYFDNFKTEKYAEKYSSLNTYFLLHEHYKKTKSNMDFLSFNNVLIHNLIMVSTIKNPNLVFNMLMNNAPLDKASYLKKRNLRSRN